MKRLLQVEQNWKVEPRISFRSFRMIRRASEQARASYRFATFFADLMVENPSSSIWGTPRIAREIMKLACFRLRRLEKDPRVINYRGLTIIFSPFLSSAFLIFFLFPLFSQKMFSSGGSHFRPSELAGMSREVLWVLAYRGSFVDAT